MKGIDEEGMVLFPVSFVERKLTLKIEEMHSIEEEEKKKKRKRMRTRKWRNQRRKET